MRSRVGAPLTFGLATLLASPAACQDPLGSLRHAVQRGDSLAATEAYGAILARAESRPQFAAVGESVLGDGGLSDAATTALHKAVAASPSDPVLYYTLGVSLRRQRRLAAADAALRDAVRLDDTSGIPRTLWAWNAIQRFDSASAVERAQTLRGAEADAIRTAAALMTQNRPWGNRIIAVCASLLGLVGSAFVLVKRSPRS